MGYVYGPCAWATCMGHVYGPHVWGYVYGALCMGLFVWAMCMDMCMHMCMDMWIDMCVVICMHLFGGFDLDKITTLAGVTCLQSHNYISHNYTGRCHMSTEP